MIRIFVLMAVAGWTGPAAAQAPAFDLNGFRLGMTAAQAWDHLDVVRSHPDVREALVPTGRTLFPRDGIAATLFMRDGSMISFTGGIYFDRSVTDPRSEAAARVAGVQMKVISTGDSLLLSEIKARLMEKFPGGRFHPHPLNQYVEFYVLMLSPRGVPAFTQRNEQGWTFIDAYYEK